MKKTNEKWINLLTEGDVDKQLEFQEILEDAPCEAIAIMKMRRLEMQDGRGQSITTEDIKNVWNDDLRLTEVLQELFLEPILDIKFIKEKIKDIEKLHNSHTQDKDRRLLTLVL